MENGLKNELLIFCIQTNSRRSIVKATFQGKEGLGLLRIIPVNVAGSEVGNLYQVNVTGANAGQVLRGRWRPAAVHQRMYTSSERPFELVVMEQERFSSAWSYSPISHAHRKYLLNAALMEPLKIPPM